MSNYHKTERIGDMNGANAWWFKFSLRAVPWAMSAMLIFSVWGVKSIYSLGSQQSATDQRLRSWMDRGDRFSQQDGLLLKMEVLGLYKSELDKLTIKIDAINSEALSFRVGKIETILLELQKQILEIGKQIGSSNQPG